MDPPHVRPWSTVQSALRCSDDGVPDADNAVRHGVAVKTIRRWRREYQRRGNPRGQVHTSARCPRCGDADLDGAAYAELLGWYLGDGHITLGRRGVFALHVYNDARYIDDNARLLDLMRAVKPDSRPHRRDVPGAVVTTVSWKHWPCLFPQHGPGRKHLRPILLEPWQTSIVEAHPGPFLRGLFHSDGCRVQNWTRRLVAGEPKRYEYPRWQFVNARALSTDAGRRHRRPCGTPAALPALGRRPGLPSDRRLAGPPPGRRWHPPPPINSALAPTSASCVLGARPGRRRVAAERPPRHQRLAARGGRATRRAHRAEDLTTPGLGRSRSAVSTRSALARLTARPPELRRVSRCSCAGRRARPR